MTTWTYIFEIPLAVAKSLVGFKHDEICSDLSGKQFAVMSRYRPAAKCSLMLAMALTDTEEPLRNDSKD